ncbi:MAG: ribonuclease T2 family protein, partial [Acidobacteriota bacterium]
MKAIVAVAMIWGAAWAQQCAVPGDVPRTRPTRVDYRNEVPTDYYALALSWSPQFCNSPAGQGERNRWQCEENAFGFVVHGLWPQSAKAKNYDEHPRNCRAPEMLPRELVRKYLCVMPSAQLMQDEWVKHGTCAWGEAKAYFERVEGLYRGLRLPELEGGVTTAGAIRKRIVIANAGSGMKPEHVQVRVVSGNRFSEVFVCYDKQFRYGACLTPGTPDGIEVRVAGRRKR